MPDIGETLREARRRAQVDVSEIEAKTKIRAKYLRALENEEWSLLPGPTFVKSFLRTYAQALGLDGKALVEQYRVGHEHPSEALLEPIVPPSQRGRQRPSATRAPSGPSPAYVALVGFIVLLIALLIYGLASSGHSKSPASRRSANATHKGAPAGKAKAGGAATGTTSTSPAPAALVTLSLRATAPVSVCLLGDGGRKLIRETDLVPGERVRTYRAQRFELKLGNNAVDMRVDGILRTVPPSSEPIAYAITKAGGRKVIPASQFPSCV